MRLPLALLTSALLLVGCPAPVQPGGPIPRSPEPPVPATFRISDATLRTPLVFVAYGDTRFTNPAETGASNPSARRALVAKIASMEPAAVFISGDLPWHGVPEDYAVYREESSPWREPPLRVYPALGNHEFSRCEAENCLENWWSAFPELRGRRWYSVSLGSQVLALALDSDSSLQPDSEQRRWLEHQLSVIDPRVRLILFLMHHPPLADEQTGKGADHNPRPNEIALAEYIDALAGHTRARIVVSAGHIHNYERFERNGAVYLVSGGGGARPTEVERTAADKFQMNDFPNYHFVRFELRGRSLLGEMYRLAPPQGWEVRDRFEITLPP